MADEARAIRTPFQILETNDDNVDTASGYVFADFRALPISSDAPVDVVPKAVAVPASAAQPVSLIKTAAVDSDENQKPPSL